MKLFVYRELIIFSISWVDMFLNFISGSASLIVLTNNIRDLYLYNDDDDDDDDDDDNNNNNNNYYYYY